MINLTISPSQGEPARQCPSVPALSSGLGKGPKLQPDMIGQDAPGSGCQFGLYWGNYRGPSQQSPVRHLYLHRGRNLGSREGQRQSLQSLFVA